MSIRQRARGPGLLYLAVLVSDGSLPRPSARSMPLSIDGIVVTARKQ